MAQDYYSILGVPRDASAQDIKTAFRQIARECHPDVTRGDPASEDRFKTARKAYETLMDPVTRGRYDRRGRRRAGPRGSFFDAFYRNTGREEEEKAPRRPGFGAHDTGGHSSSRRAGRDPGNDLNLDDLFGDFGFGRRGTKEGPGTRTSKASPRDTSPKPGADVHLEVDVPDRIALQGGSVTAVYYRMQRADSWRPGSGEPGLVRIQDIADIRVIPGTRDGQVLRERGCGDAGAHGGPYGDLVVRVRLVGADVTPKARPSKKPAGRTANPDPDKTSNHKSEVELEISVVEALLGGRVEFGTPRGPVRLAIPPGTSSGTRMRLKGKGQDASGCPVDLYVRIRIVVPKQLDDPSRQLIEEFARLNPENPRD
ncbi:MAG: J domain-containing protein [Deltaproteobacteria bacterium]|nr:J domain-containing protein [Deltaproteobacteria bacterium]